MKKKLVILALVFVAANVADILLTWSLVGEGGSEANPIMAFFLAGGFWKSFLLKVLIPTEIALVMVRKRRAVSLGILATVFVLIATWNLTWVLVL